MRVPDTYARVGHKRNAQPTLALRTLLSIFLTLEGYSFAAFLPEAASSVEEMSPMRVRG